MQAIPVFKLESLKEFTSERPISDRQTEYVTSTSAKMQVADAADKHIEKERLRERKKMKRLKEKESRREVQMRCYFLSSFRLRA